MVHQPVLLKEVSDFWHSKRDGFYIDATVGTGGHTEALLEQDSRAVCLALDRDPEAIQIAQKRLSKFGNRILLLKENYVHLPELIQKFKLPPADGILFDLGVSSLQLGAPVRGFSFMNRGPLDMRMDPEAGETAAELIRRLSTAELAKLIQHFGEEFSSKPIASALKKAEARGALRDTVECAKIISRAVFSKRRSSGKSIHPATKTFQALRIGVNRELENVAEMLKKVPSLMGSRGRVIFISFHSLEDRLVKTEMKKWTRGCICPSDFPQCVCGRNPEFKILTPKVLRPTEIELKKNPRSRSARMRVAEKI